MKADELMIGDWLLNGCGNLMQVTAIFEDGINGVCEGGECCDLYNIIKPIPLTPEILKKNGFKEAELKEPNTTNLVRKWWSKHGEIYIKEYYLARSREITYVVGGGHRMRIENIYMVHQLQHALRLCGLNELAGNFKV